MTVSGENARCFNTGVEEKARRRGRGQSVRPQRALAATKDPGRLWKDVGNNKS